MPKKSSLRDRCLAEAPRPWNLNWLQKLPVMMREELEEIIREWIAGGEIRKAYPSLRSFSLWIAELEEVTAKASTIRLTISEMAKLNA